MFRIALINMPFSNPLAPSLGLTQLEAVTQAEFGDRVSCHTVYANQDFASRVGIETYWKIGGGIDNLGTGLGEWFFRTCAFPDLPDNAGDYFQRYYLSSDDRTRELKRIIMEQREQLGRFLDDTIDRYELDQADLVGFTSMFTQSLASVALAQRIKERRPDLVTVLGGANCESPMGAAYARNLDAIDFVFSGPALKSFPRFVEHLIENEPDRCHDVQGVFSKTNAALRSMSLPLGEELDIDVPVPLDFTRFFASLDRNFPNAEHTPTLHFETSRGCWWGQRAHCTFCGLNGSTMGYRSMKAERAVEQFQSLFEYADRRIELNSVDNIMPTDYPKKVFPKLRTPDTVTMFYEVKASLPEDDFPALARAHVRTVQPGIEALATSTLKLMRKGTSSFQNIAFLKNCLRYGIKPEWNLLVGFPREEEDVFRKYVDDAPRLTHLPPPGGAYPVRFDRFSPYFVDAAEYELDLQPYDFYGLAFPFDENSIREIAYYFMDQNFRAPYVRAQAKWLGKVQAAVDAWVARWQKGCTMIAPKLHFTNSDEGRVVYDSRLGEVVLHRLDPLEARILQQLDEMKTPPKLAAALAGVRPSEIAGALDSLSKQGLLFEERDRLISLVLPTDTQPWYACDTIDPLGSPVRPDRPRPKTTGPQRASREAHRVTRRSTRNDASGRES